MKPARNPLRWPGYLLGFAMGGFLDGILLHQILQWHHLLSLVDGISNQVMFDGLFHALMYVIALIGLITLFEMRSALRQPGSGRLSLGAALIGSGTWHVLDGVMSHWLVGIHRIKQDSSNPLAWDLAWFGLFGILPIMVGRRLRGRAGRSTGGATAFGLTATALAGGSWAARPPANSDTAVIAFWPGTSQGEALNALIAAEGRPLWQSSGVWVVRWDGPARSDLLDRSQTLFVSNGLAGAGCLAWSKD